MNKGEIVLIPFPFSDFSGAKNRPAVILIETDEDVTVAFITTQLKWKTEFDILSLFLQTNQYDTFVSIVPQQHALRWLDNQECYVAQILTNNP